MIKIFKCKRGCGATVIDLCNGIKFTPPFSKLCVGNWNPEWHIYELDTIETLKTVWTTPEEYEKVKEDILEKMQRDNGKE